MTEGIGTEDIYQLELSFPTIPGRNDVISGARHRIQTTRALSPVFFAPEVESLDEDVLAGQP